MRNRFLARFWIALGGAIFSSAPFSRDDISSRRQQVPVGVKSKCTFWMCSKTSMVHLFEAAPFQRALYTSSSSQGRSCSEAPREVCFPVAMHSCKLKLKATHCVIMMPNGQWPLPRRRRPCRCAWSCWPKAAGGAQAPAHPSNTWSATGGG